MSEIIVRNQKILDFYKRNPSLNFEKINLIIIDLLDQLQNGEHNSLVNSQILTHVDELKSNVQELLKSHENISDKVLLKMRDCQKEYVEEYKYVLSNNLSHNNEKINSLVHQNTLNLIDTKNNSMLNPFLNIVTSSEDRIQKELAHIKENVISENLLNDLTEFFAKFKNSSYKGQIGETQLETVLNKLFPCDEIINTTSTKASCDFRINRHEKQPILIETKHYERNVTLDEVKKFIRDIELNKCSGIFLSQHSGITSKQNFQLDISGKNIMIYIHNVKYDPTVIKLAIDTIDNISEKLKLINTDNAVNFSISEENLCDFNKEYSNFIEQKLNLIEVIKSTQKSMLSQIEEMKFPCLSKYLSQKCGTNNEESSDIICSLCNNFVATSNKSLAAHQRACKKKLANSENQAKKSRNRVNSGNIVINTENCDEFAAIQENEENIVEFGENSVKIV